MDEPANMPSLETLLRQVCSKQNSLTLPIARQLAGQLQMELCNLELAALQLGICPERFTRNIGVIDLGEQARLLRTKLAIVGLGGLGGFVLESLARLGVGETVGIDGDAFDESNLNRQLLSVIDTLGQAKANSAQQRYAAINPAGRFRALPTRLEEANDDIFAGCRAVFDCLDNIPSRRALSRRCDRLSLTLIHGAVAGRTAQVAICPPGAGVFDKLYPSRCSAPPKTPAVLASTVMTAAGLMVSVAMNFMLGREQAKPSLWVLDLTEGRCEQVSF